jgi:hypothetical protein
MARAALLALAVFVLADRQAVCDPASKNEPKKDRPKLTIGKETTFVTEPLDKDGCIDYAAALNKEMGKGITPQTNANVVLWKAYGPRPEGVKPMPAEYFKLLGIEAPQERGDYFISFHSHLKERLKLNYNQIDVLLDQQDRATQRLWTAKDYPQVAEWLKLNEKPLAVVLEATQLPRYFNPLIANKGEPIPAGLLGAPLSHVQMCREIAKALAGRALLRAEEGKLEAAWQDLLTCCRLGRVVSQGATLIELLVAIAIDDIAGRACVALLEQGRLTTKQIQSCLRDLSQLPPMPSVAAKIALAERFIVLDSIFLFSQHGFEYLWFVDGLTSKPTPDPKSSAFLKTVDWDPGLKNANQWCDRMVKTFSIKNHRVRARLVKDLKRDIAILRVEAGEIAPRFRRAYYLRLPDKELAKPLSNLVLSILLPAIDKVQESADRNEQTQRNLQLAFALAAFKADKGAFPKKLSELTPKYLPEVPDDLFSGMALIYQPDAKGYLLYSVGLNGENDGGRGRDDDPPGDDLSVRIPFRELKRKE